MNIDIKRKKPLNDDGSSIGRPPCGPIEWTVYSKKEPEKTKIVIAQTWFKARELATIALETEPEHIIVVQKDSLPLNIQKPTTTVCPLCSPIKASKMVACKTNK